jgi:hypothetical protein
MTFSDRDNFIVASVLMVSSSSLKSVPRETRQAVLNFIRETKYPSITDDEWREISKGINDHKKEIMEILYKGFNASISNPSNTAEKSFAELDSTVKETIDEIDFDELKKVATESDDPTIREYWLSMKQLKRDFDEKK